MERVVQGGFGNRVGNRSRNRFMSYEHKRTSKFLSLVLRHKPETIGIELDSQGWVNVDVLLKAMNANKKQIDRDLLEEIVRKIAIEKRKKK